MSREEPSKISEVFRTTGQPTITYVQRDSGNYERRLNGYLDEAGQLCLITGPSKTGKTTLYKQVLNQRGEIPLIVQCTEGRNCEEIWRVALEGVNFDRVVEKSQGTNTSISAEAEVSSTFGWKWLAGITGALKGSFNRDTSEGEVRERILSNPSPDLLIPILKETRYVLVIEDFHYLEESQKILLFQQWKRFVDNEISIIVLGTTHRAVDIANSNRDLVGRISRIDVGHWDESDLIKICDAGFGYLRCQIAEKLSKKICSEAVGLPIIVQQICLQIFSSQSIFLVSAARKKKISVRESNVVSSFYDVATEKYRQFESYYSTLIRGPREKNRKYRTYELVLACFTVDPITFSLTRAEIDSRISKLEIDASEKPPAASLNSTLGALKKFQTKREFQLLEWRPTEDTLYIVEPSFLFYVRWRKKKSGNSGEQLDLFEELLRNLNVKASNMLLISKAQNDNMGDF
ncbi:hypothetical protein [Mesorhizobium sp. IMUNJ 23232]|uniref:hypothetical protein n=1 Tax=Mesorhizobium sp. IMUNJ 23232 TaxID=3376064 RepID=UPI00378BFA82